VDYDRVYLEMARRGARVLALGHRRLGNLSHQDVSKCLSLYKLPLWVYKKTGLSDNLKLQLVATKSGKIHYVIMDNVIWTNQNELSVYLCHMHMYCLIKHVTLHFSERWMSFQASVAILIAFFCKKLV